MVTQKIKEMFLYVIYLFSTCFSCVSKKITDENSDYVVSLTSYGYRIKKSWMTLKSILLQRDFHPRSIILWISYEDSSLITKRIRRFEKYGLTIKLCQNYKSYKKIIETAKEYKDLKIITVDDDVIYPKKHFFKLVELSKKYPDCVCCYRAHRILFNEGLIRKYVDWDFGSKGIIGPDFLLVPIGFQGILYPKSYYFNEDYLDYSTIKEIAPNQDDLWLRFIGLKGNIKVVKVFDYDVFTPDAPFTQKNTLYQSNIVDNDIAIDKLQNYFSIKLSNFQEQKE